VNPLYAIVDIETNGRYASANGITEIAIVLHNGKEIVDRYSTLINPGTTIVPFISRLTGITNDMLQGAPRFHEVAKKIWEMTDNAIFVAHNVNFDYNFIREEFKELGADFKRKKLCTVRLSRAVFPGHPSYSLGEICNQLNIPISDRHRALGDALATVKLFEKCLANNGQETIDKLLKRNSNLSVLPSNLASEKFDQLPESCGVYYFHDKNGKIIYVGKAINIKKRIYSHFTGKGRNKISFTNAIFDISYQLCGTELISLLLESQEIKKHFPIYNVVQKFDRGLHVLTEYVNQKGIHQLLCTKAGKNVKAMKAFGSFEEARETMQFLIDEFGLCPKYCGLQTSTGACFDFQTKKCKGVCADKESIEKYNKRVKKAIKYIIDSESRMIIGDGRTENEKSIVLIEEGFFKGFGYYDSGMVLETIEQAREIITPFKHTGDIHRILDMFSLD
jgi:DNA polymerase-3 subunit epsilon